MEHKNIYQLVLAGGSAVLLQRLYVYSCSAGQRLYDERYRTGGRWYGAAFCAGLQYLCAAVEVCEDDGAFD